MGLILRNTEVGIRLQILEKLVFSNFEQKTKSKKMNQAVLYFAILVASNFDLLCCI